MEKQILNLLLNIKSFFKERSKSPDFEIHFSDTYGQNYMEFELRVSGVVLTAEEKNKIQQASFSDTEVLNTPSCKKLYTAWKIVSQLNGRLHCVIPNDEEIFVHTILPKGQT